MEYVPFRKFLFTTLREHRLIFQDSSSGLGEAFESIGESLGESLDALDKGVDMMENLFDSMPRDERRVAIEGAIAQVDESLAKIEDSGEEADNQRFKSLVDHKDVLQNMLIELEREDEQVTDVPEDNGEVLVTQQTPDPVPAQPTDTPADEPADVPADEPAEAPAAPAPAPAAPAPAPAAPAPAPAAPAPTTSETGAETGSENDVVPDAPAATLPEGLPGKFEDDLNALTAGPTKEQLDAFVQEFNDWDASFADPDGDFKTEEDVAAMKQKIFSFAQSTEGILFTVDDITKANSTIEYEILAADEAGTDDPAATETVDEDAEQAAELSPEQKAVVDQGINNLRTLSQKGKDHTEIDKQDSEWSSLNDVLTEVNNPAITNQVLADAVEAAKVTDVAVRPEGVNLRLEKKSFKEKFDEAEGIEKLVLFLKELLKLGKREAAKNSKERSAEDPIESPADAADETARLEKAQTSIDERREALQDLPEEDRDEAEEALDKEQKQLDKQRANLEKALSGLADFVEASLAEENIFVEIDFDLTDDNFSMSVEFTGDNPETNLVYNEAKGYDQALVADFGPYAEYITINTDEASRTVTLNLDVKAMLENTSSATGIGGGAEVGVDNNAEGGNSEAEGGNAEVDTGDTSVETGDIDTDAEGGNAEAEGGNAEVDVEGGESDAEGGNAEGGSSESDTGDVDVQVDGTNEGGVDIDIDVDVNEDDSDGSSTGRRGGKRRNGKRGDRRGGRGRRPINIYNINNNEVGSSAEGGSAEANAESSAEAEAEVEAEFTVEVPVEQNVSIDDGVVLDTNTTDSSDGDEFVDF